MYYKEKVHEEQTKALPGNLKLFCANVEYGHWNVNIKLIIKEFKLRSE